MIPIPWREGEHQTVLLSSFGLKEPLTGLKAALQNFFELSGTQFHTFIYQLQCLPPFRGAWQWEWGGSRGQA